MQFVVLGIPDEKLPRFPVPEQLVHVVVVFEAVTQQQVLLPADRQGPQIQEIQEFNPGDCLFLRER